MSGELPTGTLNPDPQSLETAVFSVKRGFFPRSIQVFEPDPALLTPLVATVTVEEDHQDELTITRQPVEQGASVADHAFKEPATIRLRLGWSQSDPAVISQDDAAGRDYLDNVYNKLLRFQAERILFSLMTTRRFYENMLLKMVSVVTDEVTSRALFVRAVCEEVIIVSTRSVLVPADLRRQESPEETASPVGRGFIQPIDLELPLGVEAVVN